MAPSAQLSRPMTGAAARMPSRRLEGQAPWVGSLAIAVLMTLGYATELSPPIAQTGGIAWRLGAVAVAAFAIHAQVSMVDAGRFAVLFAPFLLALAILVAATPDEGAERLADLLRQLFLVGVGSLAYACGRDPLARRRIRLMLLYLAAITAVLAAASAAPMLSHGWSYQAGRHLKALSAETQGFGANAGCFGALIALMASCGSGRRVPLPYLALGLMLAFLSIVLTVRAPIAALFVSGAIAAPLARSRWLPRLARSPAIARATVMAGLGLIVGGFLLSVDMIARSSAAGQLAGRAALWQIGMTGWWAHPLVGHGPNSMVAVIRERLGAATPTNGYEIQALHDLSAGGFHNMWINTLVERGLIGFTGVFLSYALVLAAGVRRAGGLPPGRRFVLLLILLFTVLRAFVEVAGLMTVGTAPLEGLMIVAVAIALAPDPRERAPARPSATAA